MNLNLKNKIVVAFLALEVIMLTGMIFSYIFASKIANADDPQKLLNIMGISFIIAVIVIISFTTVTLVSLARRLRLSTEKIKAAEQQMLAGDVENLVCDDDVNDEFGEIIKSFAAIGEEIKQQAKVVERVSDGDLTTDVVPKSSVDLMGNSLKNLITRNNNALSHIRDAAEQVNVASSEVASASETLAQGSTEQASAIEQITASIDDVADKTKENAKKADDAADLMAKAIVNMQKGNKQMEEMVSAMNDINVSSENISKIIKVIDDIAFQTNILALNAAVEAARAGEAGMGFAVVAEEVRNLAAKSSSAAAETAEMIADSIKKIEAGTSIADDTMKSIEEISDVVSESETIIKEIAQASNYQATAIAQIDQAVSQVSQVVSNNSATSEECAAASFELSSQAKRMNELLAVYRLDESDSASAKGGYSSKSYSSSSSRNEQIISLGEGFGKY